MRVCCIAFCRLGLFAVLAALLAGLPDAHGHDSYPLECCSEQDCAPAEAVVRREDGSFLVTSRGMSVVIPADYSAWRKSPDERIHVCIRRLRSGGEYLICAFRGPGS